MNVGISEPQKRRFPRLLIFNPSSVHASVAETRTTGATENGKGAGETPGEDGNNWSLRGCGLRIADLSSKRAKTTLYRISRDFLAVRSPLFYDMLSLPTPKDADMMDGCPFVPLSDAAKDVTVFLKALLYCHLNHSSGKTEIL
ncbi:hypothetical protein C8F04DRAFT_1183525 [Mycena alexandri]|uniref:BTB domain-containing protein n=1 Tax=Mycena alexandri TaxID=1745969 RepID=A0AAD6X0F0_9AGAR|nr:hypothetical protein C8F04DRAFT_1183525 [Mycena alexandri]